MVDTKAVAVPFVIPMDLAKLTGFKKNDLSIEACVARGVEVLDQNIPDWFTRVKVRALKMEDACKCVLGQIFGPSAKSNPIEDKYGYRAETGYEYAVELYKLGRSSGAVEKPRWSTVTYPVSRDSWLGFDYVGDTEYQYLTAEWKKVIKQKLKLAEKSNA